MYSYYPNLDTIDVPTNRMNECLGRIGGSSTAHAWRICHVRHVHAILWGSSVRELSPKTVADILEDPPTALTLSLGITLPPSDASVNPRVLSY